MLKGLAVGGPLHGKVISSSRHDVQVAEECFSGRWPRYMLDESTEFRRGLYRAERLAMAGSSKRANFWVYEAHSPEAAKGMAWEMLLAAAERVYGDCEEVRFP
ncbi:hypothetical protein ACWD3J_15490 [Streptomyces sp. NPDC002755]